MFEKKNVEHLRLVQPAYGSPEATADRLHDLRAGEPQASPAENRPGGFSDSEGGRRQVEGAVRRREKGR